MFNPIRYESWALEHPLCSFWKIKSLKLWTLPPSYLGSRGTKQTRQWLNTNKAANQYFNLEGLNRGGVWKWKLKIPEIARKWVKSKMVFKHMPEYALNIFPWYKGLLSLHQCVLLMKSQGNIYHRRWPLLIAFPITILYSLLMELPFY